MSVGPVEIDEAAAAGRAVGQVVGEILEGVGLSAAQKRKLELVQQCVNKLSVVVSSTSTAVTSQASGGKADAAKYLSSRMGAAKRRKSIAGGESMLRRKSQSSRSVAMALQDISNFVGEGVAAPSQTSAVSRKRSSSSAATDDASAGHKMMKAAKKKELPSTFALQEKYTSLEMCKTLKSLKEQDLQIKSVVIDMVEHGCVPMARAQVYKLLKKYEETNQVRPSRSDDFATERGGGGDDGD